MENLILLTVWVAALCLFFGIGGWLCDYYDNEW